MNFPEQFRSRMPDSPYASSHGDPFGIFIIPDGADRLFILATDGDLPEMPDKWEHVSVSVRNRRGVILQRCPTWEQMSKVKDLFWSDDEAVMQLHPPRSDYVNQHAYCLHLWRPINVAIPLPPSILVGLKDGPRIA